MGGIWKKVHVANLALTAMSGVSGVGLWMVFGKQLPPQIPIFYSRPWGEAQLGQPMLILILPMLAVVVGVGAGIISKKLTKELPLAVMVWSTSIVAQLILILGMLRIIFTVL